MKTSMKRKTRDGKGWIQTTITLDREVRKNVTKDARKANTSKSRIINEVLRGHYGTKAKTFRRGFTRH